jgi:NADH dehydrogenase
MILVVGATGQLGSKITSGLLARSRDVRVLSRPASADQAAHLGADVVLGDLKDRPSLDAACAGVDTVITTANSVRRGGDDTVSSVDASGTRSLIEAARAAGVRRFIYTSVLGAAPDSPVPFLAAKAANEAHLRESGLAWTVLAPNAFMESWPARVVGAPALAGAPVVIVGEGRRRHTFVAEDDVAAFAVAAVENPHAVHQRVAIGGPEALSWRDVVALYERVVGQPLEVRFVGAGEPVPGLPPAVLPLLASFDTYDSVFDTQQPASLFGITLTSLETVARRQAALKSA